jgi:hypothetical protein
MVRDNLERFLFGYASMLDAIKPKKNLFLRDSSISIIKRIYGERTNIIILTNSLPKYVEL